MIHIFNSSQIDDHFNDNLQIRLPDFRLELIFDHSYESRMTHFISHEFKLHYSSFGSISLCSGKYTLRTISVLQTDICCIKRHAQLVTTQSFRLDVVLGRIRFGSTDLKLLEVPNYALRRTSVHGGHHLDHSVTRGLRLFTRSVSWICSKSFSVIFAHQCTLERLFRHRIYGCLSRSLTRVDLALRRCGRHLLDWSRETFIVSFLCELGLRAYSSRHAQKKTDKLW